MRTLRLLPLLMLLTLVLAPGTAPATTVLRVPIDEMARSVDLIVRGVVEDVTVREAGDKARRIETHVTLKVGKVLKGHASGPYLTIRLFGGRIGDRSIFLPGMPGFRVGEDVVLFLEHTSEGFKPAGLSLGKFTVERDADSGLVRARRYVAPRTAMRRVGPEGRLVDDAFSDSDDDLLLDDLVGTIERAVPRKGGVR